MFTTFWDYMEKFRYIIAFSGYEYNKQFHYNSAHLQLPKPDSSLPKTARFLNKKG